IHTFPRFTTIRPQIRWALRHADSVAGVCNSLAGSMLKLEPALAHVDVIGNGVDGERFFPEDRQTARQRLGLDTDEKIILSVAALRPVKGCDLLVRAISELRKTTPRCGALFVGQGPELPALRRLAAELGCSDVCTFVGSVSNHELRYYYSAADVSCLAS